MLPGALWSLKLNLFKWFLMLPLLSAPVVKWLQPACSSRHKQKDEDFGIIRQLLKTKKLNIKQ